MHTDEMLFGELSEQIIGCAIKVQNTLGAGFVEKVYENALAYELRMNGLAVQQQCSIQVHYEDVIVGDYVADILVDGLVVVELKAVKALDNVHRAQCLNYLKATGLHLCLLMNFGNPRLEFKRLVS